MSNHLMMLVGLQNQPMLSNLDVTGRNFVAKDGAQVVWDCGDGNPLSSVQFESMRK